MEALVDCQLVGGQWNGRAILRSPGGSDGSAAADGGGGGRGNGQSGPPGLAAGGSVQLERCVVRPAQSAPNLRRNLRPRTRRYSAIEIKPDQFSSEMLRIELTRSSTIEASLRSQQAGQV